MIDTWAVTWRVAGGPWSMTTALIAPSLVCPMSMALVSHLGLS
jgi:hypothetical protein